MADVSRDFYQAIIVPDPRVEVWDAESSVSPKGPHAGHPTTTSELTLRSKRVELSGDLSDDIVLTCRQPGLPQPAPSTRAGAYSWKYDGDASTNEDRGWNPPSRSEDYSAILVGSASQDYENAFVTITATGRRLLVCEDDDGINRQFRVLRRDAGDTGWTQIANLNPPDADQGRESYPCLVAIDDPDDQRVMLYYWRHNSTDDIATIGAMISTDDGETWGTTLDSVTNEVLPVVENPTGSLGDYEEVHRLAGAYRNGEVVILASMRTVSNGRSYVHDVYRQYASSDSGYTFTALGEWADEDNNGGRYPHILADDDGFHLIHLVLDRANDPGMPEHRVIARAYEKYENAAATLIDVGHTRWSTTTANAGANYAAEITSGICAFCMDEAGVYYVHGVSTLGGKGRAARSYDRGATWEAVEASPDVGDTEGWYEGPSTHRPKDVVSIAYEGAILLIGACDTTAGTVDNTISQFRLGGYTSVESPPVGLGGWENKRAAWTQTWVSTEIPNTFDSSVFTRSSSGTVTESVATGALVITGVSTVSETLYEDSFGAVDPDAGFEGTFVLKTDDSTVQANNMFHPGIIDVVLADATNAYGIRVSVTDANAYVYEKTGAGSVAGDYTLLGSKAVTDGAKVMVRIAMRGNDAKVWIRVHDEGHDDLFGAPVADESALTDIGAHFSAGRVQFGGVVQNIGAGADAVTWYFVGYNQPTGVSTSDDRALNLLNMSNPGDLQGRPYSVRGGFVAEGVEVYALDGVAAIGDTHTITTAYDHPLSRTLEDSPRRTFEEASGVTSVGTYAWRWATDGDTYNGSDILGIALYGSTLSSITLDLYDAGTSSWTSSKSINLHQGGLAWGRNGHTIEPNGAESLMLRDAEHDGAFFSPSVSTQGSRIANTQGGKWNTGYRICALHLESTTQLGSYAASGAGGVIVSRDVVLLVSLAGTRYTGVRIQASNATRQLVPEQRHAIGRAVIGPCFIHADASDWGRAIAADGMINLEELDDGSVRAEVLGADVRRDLEVAWAAGIDTRRATLDDDEPDLHYLDESKDEVDGHTGMTAWQLMGLHRRLRGGLRQAVYLPRVETIPTSDGYRVLRRRHEHALMRLGTQIRMDTVMGDENVDEVVRLQLAMREEV